MEGYFFGELLFFILGTVFFCFCLLLLLLLLLLSLLLLLHPLNKMIFHCHVSIRGANFSEKRRTFNEEWPALLGLDTKPFLKACLGRSSRIYPRRLGNYRDLSPPVGNPPNDGLGSGKCPPTMHLIQV